MVDDGPRASFEPFQRLPVLGNREDVGGGGFSVDFTKFLFDVRRRALDVLGQRDESPHFLSVEALIFPSRSHSCRSTPQ
jgi:hypothetical protein